MITRLMNRSRAAAVAGLACALLAAPAPAAQPSAFQQLGTAARSGVQSLGQMIAKLKAPQSQGGADASENRIIGIEAAPVAAGTEPSPRFLRVLAEVCDRGYPSIAGSMTKLSANAAQIQLDIKADACGSKALLEFTVFNDLDAMLSNLGLDPRTAKIVYKY